MKKLILGYQKLLDQKASQEEITLFLIQNGVLEDKIDEFCKTYDTGFKSGVNHVITGGLSSEKTNFGEDPVFDSAFNMGKHIFKTESSLFYKYRFMVFGTIMAIVVIIIKGYV